MNIQDFKKGVKFQLSQGKVFTIIEDNLVHTKLGWKGNIVYKTDDGREFTMDIDNLKATADNFRQVNESEKLKTWGKDAKTLNFVPDDELQESEDVESNKFKRLIDIYCGPKAKPFDVKKTTYKGYIIWSFFRKIKSFSVKNPLEFKNVLKKDIPEDKREYHIIEFSQALSDFEPEYEGESPKFSADEGGRNAAIYSLEKLIDESIVLNYEPDNNLQEDAYEDYKAKHPDFNWEEAENEIPDDELQAAADYVDRNKKSHDWVTPEEIGEDFDFYSDLFKNETGVRPHGLSNEDLAAWCNNNFKLVNKQIIKRDEDLNESLEKMLNERFGLKPDDAEEEYKVRVAKAYQKAPMFDPKATKHWDSLLASSKNFYRKTLSTIDVIYTDKEMYADAQEMKDDVKNNKRMYVSLEYTGHPYWSDEDYQCFRAVHDYIVHVLGDSDFTLHGELRAVNLHMKLVPAMARPAVFLEIPGKVCSFLTTGHFPPSKIAVLQGFDFNNVGRVIDTPERDLHKPLVMKDDAKQLAAQDIDPGEAPDNYNQEEEPEEELADVNESKQLDETSIYSETDPTDGDYDDIKQTKKEVESLYDEGERLFKIGRPIDGERLRQYALKKASWLGWTDLELPPYDKQQGINEKIIKTLKESKFGRTMGKFQDYGSKVINILKKNGANENEPLDLALISQCFSRGTNARECANFYLQVKKIKRMNENSEKIIKVKEAVPYQGFYKDPNGDKFYKDERGNIYTQVESGPVGRGTVQWYICTPSGEPEVPVHAKIVIEDGLIEENNKMKNKKILNERFEGEYAFIVNDLTGLQNWVNNVFLEKLPKTFKLIGWDITYSKHGKETLVINDLSAASEQNQKWILANVKKYATDASDILLESKQILNETSHEVPAPKYLINYGEQDVVTAIKKCFEDYDDATCSQIAAVGDTQFYNVAVTLKAEDEYKDLEAKRFMIAQRIHKLRAQFFLDLSSILPVVNINMGNYEFTKSSDTVKCTFTVLMSQTNQRDWVSGEYKQKDKSLAKKIQDAIDNKYKAD